MSGRVPVPRRGSVSAILAELASAPERDLRSAWQRQIESGAVIGRFELRRELGRGGFGIVFEARDQELGRLVAFKAIRPGPREQDPTREALLRSEAEAIAQLQHPNLVTLFDFGRCDSGPYLILELLRGETLAELLARGPVPVREAVHVATEVTRALVHAHAAGVLHRDLKPSNVFLTADGAVKVLDFGLAHVFGAGGPAGSGTPGYMAPEQVRGDAEDARTDVFAVGVLLHEMIHGERPGRASKLDDPMATPVPPALADLVADALAPNPAVRPRDARTLLDGLLAIERSLDAGRVRRRRLTAIALVAAAALAAAVGWFAGYRGLQLDRTTVAVADFQNETGDPHFDGLSGLLIVSLEQSPRLIVVPRERLFVLARDAGFAEGLDASAARVAALQAGADMLFLATVSRSDAGYTIDLRAVHPRTERALFPPLRERGGPDEGIFDLVDRLSHDMRRKLGENEAELSKHMQPIGTMTRDREAYRHYFLGEQCAVRPLYGQDCAIHFRDAIARDSGFAAAHYQLAVWSAFNGNREEQRAAMRAAVEHAGRAPEKERLEIEAWAAYLAGRDDEAFALYRRVTERFPQDKHAWYQIGDILRHRDEFEEAIPWFERAIELDPEFGWALTHLVEALGATGRMDALRAWVTRWEASPRPATLHALSLAYGWLGELAAATDAAERAATLGAGLAAQEDLLAIRIFKGAYDSVDRELSALASPGSEVRPVGYYALAAVAAYQGRPREGLDRLDALRAAFPALERDALYLSLRVDYLIGTRALDAIRPDLEALRQVDPPAAAKQAPALAWLGAIEDAAALAPGLRRGSPLAETYDAIILWHRGERDTALDLLREISEKTPISVWRVAPLFLYGELAARSGRDAEAVEALERFRKLYVPRMMWRSWALPLSEVRLAQAYARLGQRAKARAEVDHFLATWGRADPNDPVVAEARALSNMLR